MAASQVAHTIPDHVRASLRRPEQSVIRRARKSGQFSDGMRRDVQTESSRVGPMLGYVREDGTVLREDGTEIGVVEYEGVEEMPGEQEQAQGQEIPLESGALVETVEKKDGESAEGMVVKDKGKEENLDTKETKEIVEEHATLNGKEKVAGAGETIALGEVVGETMPPPPPDVGATLEAIRVASLQNIRTSQGDGMLEPKPSN